METAVALPVPPERTEAWVWDLDRVEVEEVGFRLRLAFFEAFRSDLFFAIT